MDDKSRTAEIPSYVLTQLEDLVWDSAQAVDSVSLLAAVLSEYSLPSLLGSDSE